MVNSFNEILPFHHQAIWSPVITFIKMCDMEVHISYIRYVISRNAATITRKILKINKIKGSAP